MIVFSLQFTNLWQVPTVELEVEKCTRLRPQVLPQGMLLESWFAELGCQQTPTRNDFETGTLLERLKMRYFQIIWTHNMSGCK